MSSAPPSAAPLTSPTPPFLQTLGSRRQRSHICRINGRCSLASSVVQSRRVLLQCSSDQLATCEPQGRRKSVAEEWRCVFFRVPVVQFRGCKPMILMYDVDDELPMCRYCTLFVQFAVNILLFTQISLHMTMSIVEAHQGTEKSGLSLRKEHQLASVCPFSMMSNSASSTSAQCVSPGLTGLHARWLLSITRVRYWLDPNN